MIAFAAALALALVSFAAMGRVVIGPTLHDRALGAYACLTSLIIWIAAFAVLDDRAQWLDVALAAALCDFVLATATFKALGMRTLQTALDRPGKAKRP